MRSDESYLDRGKGARLCWTGTSKTQGEKRRTRKRKERLSGKGESERMIFAYLDEGEQRQTSFRVERRNRRRGRARWTRHCERPEGFAIAIAITPYYLVPVLPCLCLVPKGKKRARLFLEYLSQDVHNQYEFPIFRGLNTP